jgi:hypothetical protein
MNSHALQGLILGLILITAFTISQVIQYRRHRGSSQK